MAYDVIHCVQGAHPSAGHTPHAHTHSPYKGSMSNDHPLVTPVQC